MVEPHIAWLFRAANDLKAVNDLFPMDYDVLDVTIYHTQQCAEKSLKGFLAFHQQDIPKTHNLAPLVVLCSKIDPSFIEMTDAAKFLTPKATEFRYTDEADSVNEVADLLPSIEDVQQAIEKATLIFDFVKQKIENKTTEHRES